MIHLVLRVHRLGPLATLMSCVRGWRSTVRRMERDPTEILCAQRERRGAKRDRRVARARLAPARLVPLSECAPRACDGALPKDGGCGRRGIRLGWRVVRVAVTLERRCWSAPRQRKVTN